MKNTRFLLCINITILHFSSKYRPILMEFGTHVLEYPEDFFFIFSKFPPVLPLGGGESPTPKKIPHLEIPSDCLKS